MSSSQPTQPKKLGTAMNFATSGLGGILGWVVVHPFNTIAVRMNLAVTDSAGKAPSFLSFAGQQVKDKGFMSLYSGLSAGCTRQLFYATSRFGLYEVFRDYMAKYRETDLFSRLLTGSVSGGIAAMISCPAEVSLVRLSNDSSLPEAQRRNYKGFADAVQRILKEEGPKAFFSGSGPFVNRAMVVGAVQVGTYDQFKSSYRSMGIVHPTLNVFCAAMTSGFLYAFVTMPLETCKNRMAFQKPDPATGKVPYTSTIQTLTAISSKEGLLKLWAGFPPYYLRCGGHTVAMFMLVEAIRKQILEFS